LDTAGGGFVKIFGEGGEGRNDPKSFASHSTAVRLKILFAGVAANWLLAAALFTFVQFIGFPISLPDESTRAVRSVLIQVSAVQDASPAEEAGFLPGAVIREIKAKDGGETIFPETIGQIQEFVRKHAGSPIETSLILGGEEVTKTLVPRADPPEGEGPLGIALARTGIVSYPWYEAPWRGVFATVSASVGIVGAVIETFRGIVSTGDVAENVGGPVAIFYFTNQYRVLGISYLLTFFGLISLLLALFNALPIPALDGGRAMFVLLEKFIGRPVPARLENLIHTSVFFALIGFMLWIVRIDLDRYFGISFF